MRENLKLGIILMVVTIIAGVLLGGAYVITKEPIARQAVQEKSLAMKEILPGADKFDRLGAAIPAESQVKEVNIGYHGSNTVGYAIKVTPKGFGGVIDLMVGISHDGKVKGIKILSHSETPGLGANAPNEAFSGQFRDKANEPALNVVKTSPSGENDIQAITGATITSRAITDGVNEAVKFYTSTLKGGASQ